MLKAATLEELIQKLEPSRKKAEKVKPLYVFVEFRHFKVESSAGGYYDVVLGRSEENGFWIACKCRGALEGKGCYHAHVVLHAHLKYIENEKKQQEKDSPYISGGTERQKKKRGDLGV